MKSTILSIAVIATLALSGCGSSVTLSRKAEISANDPAHTTEREICGLVLPDNFHGQFTYKTDKCDVGVNNQSPFDDQYLSDDLF